MKAQDILDAINGEIIYLTDNEALDNEYEYGFATDLMSDALALIQENETSTVLITGLANIQSVNTADMLDISLIIFVRDKQLADDVISHAKNHNISLFKSGCSMYQVCGMLYEKGLGSIDVNCLS